MFSCRVIGRMSEAACLCAVLAAYYLLTAPAMGESVGAPPRRIAELQLQQWREKLKGAAVPEAVLARLSPLTHAQLHKFKAILQNPNRASALDATEFCGSSGLLCHQYVGILEAGLFAYGVNHGYTEEQQRGMFIDAEELKKGGRLTIPDLHDPIPRKAFLPQSLAEMMPFSASALPQLLELLRISPGSNMSHNMMSTLNACEGTLEEGEVRRCSTSIESMVDFVLSKVGGSVQLVSHPDIAGSGKAGIIRKLQRRKYVPSRPPVACHSMPFPFGVYYCHSIDGTHAIDMEVEMVEDGNVIKGTAVCHRFSKANETVCHLIYGGTLLWLPKRHQ